jgi:hypothetical protein
MQLDGRIASLDEARVKAKKMLTTDYDKKPKPDREGGCKGTESVGSN